MNDLLLTATLPWTPFPKERPRSNKNSMAVYTPTPTKKAEERLQKLFRDFVGPEWEALTGPLEVNFEFDDETVGLIIRRAPKHTSKLRGDLDNYAKTALDALNGLAYVDDRYVERMTAVKL